MTSSYYDNCQNARESGAEPCNPRRAAEKKTISASVSEQFSSASRAGLNRTNYAAEDEDEAAAAASAARHVSTSYRATALCYSCVCVCCAAARCSFTHSLTHSRPLIDRNIHTDDRHPVGRRKLLASFSPRFRRSEQRRQPDHRRIPFQFT